MLRMFRVGLLLALVGVLGFASSHTHAQEKEKDKEKKEPPIIAHVKLSGSLDEAPVGESLFGSTPGENLRSLLERISKAKKDPKVQTILVELNGLELGTFSFGKIEEVRYAIKDARASGKKVFCYAEDFGGLDYLIACAADRVIIPESGGFGLMGLHMEMSFYKNALDLVKVKGDFLTMGEAKGAVEPFTRDSMGPENKKQYNLVLDDLYDRGIVETIVSSRASKKWKADDVKKLIDTAPFSAKKSLDKGLIDAILYADQLEEYIRKETNIKDLTLQKDYLKPKGDKDRSTFGLLMDMMSPPKKSKKSKNPKIAIIYAVGEINTGKSGGSLLGGNSMGSDTIIEAIREAETDPNVKAIVLRIDSPGGSALASDLMWRELKRCEKPVVASMGDVAASGGYYISTSSKKVFAEAGTLTGSIGVLGGKIVIGGLKEWAGIKTETLTRGKNAGAFSTTTPFSQSEKESITELMQETYDQFLDKTIAGRQANGVKMDKKTLLPLAGGRIWTGKQAKDLGLVDAIGTLEDAILEAKVLAKLPKDQDIEFLILPEPTNPLDNLLGGGLGLKAQSQAIQEALKLTPEMKPHLKQAEMLLKMQKDKVWLVAPVGISVR